MSHVQIQFTVMKLSQELHAQAPQELTLQSHVPRLRAANHSVFEGLFSVGSDLRTVVLAYYYSSGGTLAHSVLSWSFMT